MPGSSIMTTTTTTTTTSCWGRMGCLVDVDERADNLKLVHATKQKNFQECKKILQEGRTNVDTREKTTKRTALHYAACLSKCKILELLLEHNAACNAQDSSGNTPLHLAIDKNRLNCCEIILKQDNLQINLANMDQNTPLHLAANKGFQNIVDNLLNLNADCNVPNRSGNTALHLAANEGFQNVVEKLLKMQADCNAPNSSGNTPLHLAAAKGHHDCCEKLLQWRGIRIDVVNDGKNTPLHLAAKGGHSNVVELLKSRQANCSAENSLGETPLHLAVIGGHLNCFQKIMEYSNLNINSPKKDGLTPLHCAAKTGNAEIVEQLLGCRADCNAKNHLEDTPLHLAVTKGYLGCCEKLLASSGLDVNRKNKNQEAPLHQAASVGRRDVCNLILQHPSVDINIKNKSHKTPLHLAAKNCNDDVVELLLNKGAVWKWRDKQAYMPLHYAAENGSEKSCQYLVKVFNEDKNKETLKLTLRDMQTPLMLAAKKGHHRCCEKLIFQDINAKDQYGNTALLYAIKGGFLNTVSFLKQNGASIKMINNAGITVLHQAAKAKADECLLYLLKTPDMKELLSAKENKNAFTPLHEAISNEALTCAKILLDHGASTWEKCKEGMTPLHLAAKQGDPGLCSLLSNDKGKVNMENKENQTPLHVAAMYGCRDACKVLLSTKGIQVLAKDMNGHTALHLAAEKGHDRVLKLLTKKGLSPFETDDDGATALHVAAQKGHLECCQILVTTSRRLIHEVDGKEKLPLDLAFEEKHDKVFAFLMRNFTPLKEDFTNSSFKNYQWASRFHKYMHQSLQEEVPRVIAAEAIIDSEWWEAAFFSQERSNTRENNQFCNNFQELVKSHPSLALKAQNHCILDDEISYDFRLFEDSNCPETRQKELTQRPVLTNSQRLLQEHPLSLMVQHTRTELLQHPLIEAWLRHLWKTYLSYLFIFLLTIEVLFLASLTTFMAYTDNWARVEHKCNSTYELLCGFEAQFSPKALEGALKSTGAAETWRMLPDNGMGSFSQCQNIVSSNFEMWFFLLCMTTVIVVLELGYIYRLGTWYFKLKRLLRFFQVCFTLILLPPTGICGFQHQMWIWTTWQWHCGIIGLLLEWLLFISMLNQLPVLFVFMPITKHFFWNYIKALGYILLLLFAFSHIFHLLLADQAAFQSWPQSMMKMIVWLLGDLNYDDTFVDSYLVYPDMGKLLFVVFIIVIGGYIANLAITQPSERLDDFRKGAAFFRMESQSTLFLELRACFPRFWELNIKCTGSKKNCLNVLGDRLAKEIMRMDITHDKSLPEENSLQNLEQQVATLMNLCTEQVEELKDLKDRLDILFRRIPEPRPYS